MFHLYDSSDDDDDDMMDDDGDMMDSSDSDDYPSSSFNPYGSSYSSSYGSYGSSDSGTSKKIDSDSNPANKLPMVLFSSEIFKKLLLPNSKPILLNSNGVRTNMPEKIIVAISSFLPGKYTFRLMKAIPEWGVTIKKKKYDDLWRQKIIVEFPSFKEHERFPACFTYYEKYLFFKLPNSQKCSFCETTFYPGSSSFSGPSSIMCGSCTQKHMIKREDLKKIFPPIPEFMKDLHTLDGNLFFSKEVQIFAKDNAKKIKNRMQKLDFSSVFSKIEEKPKKNEEAFANLAQKIKSAEGNRVKSKFLELTSHISQMLNVSEEKAEMILKKHLKLFMGEGMNPMNIIPKLRIYKNKKENLEKFISKRLEIQSKEKEKEKQPNEKEKINSIQNPEKPLTKEQITSALKSDHGVREYLTSQYMSGQDPERIFQQALDRKSKIQDVYAQFLKILESKASVHPECPELFTQVFSNTNLNEITAKEITSFYSSCLYNPSVNKNTNFLKNFPPYTRSKILEVMQPGFSFNEKKVEDYINLAKNEMTFGKELEKYGFHYEFFLNSLKSDNEVGKYLDRKSSMTLHQIMTQALRVCHNVMSLSTHSGLWGDNQGNFSEDVQEKIVKHGLDKLLFDDLDEKSGKKVKNSEKKLSETQKNELLQLQLGSLERYESVFEKTRPFLMEAANHVLIPGSALETCHGSPEKTELELQELKKRELEEIAKKEKEEKEKKEKLENEKREKKEQKEREKKDKKEKEKKEKEEKEKKKKEEKERKKIEKEKKAQKLTEEQEKAKIEEKQAQQTPKAQEIPKIEEKQAIVQEIPKLAEDKQKETEKQEPIVPIVQQTPEKRRRGRPKKSETLKKAAEQKEEKMEIETEKPENVVSTPIPIPTPTPAPTPTPTPAKRKRGRPPKKKQTEAPKPSEEQKEELKQTETSKPSEDKKELKAENEEKEEKQAGKGKKRKIDDEEYNDQEGEDDEEDSIDTEDDEEGTKTRSGRLVKTPSKFANPLESPNKKKKTGTQK